MTPNPESAPWQPITFGGVARLAGAGWARLWLVELVVAGLAAVAIGVFLGVAWFPTFQAAIYELPEDARIRRGRLEWPDSTLTTLAKSGFLAIQVDPSDEVRAGATSDLLVEFGSGELRLHSVFGYVAVPYPSGWVLEMSRQKIQPWWGAWKPAILVGSCLGAALALCVVWGLLATIYTVPARVVAAFNRRGATFGTCWRLATAALMPGTLIMSAALVLYTFRRLNLIEFLAAVALHLVVPWIYLLVSPHLLPRAEPAGKPHSKRKNPFES